MSILRAQAVRFSIINYFATFFAAVSTLWIYPLELDAYGLAQFLISFAMLCIPVATFGTLTLIMKFFPEFKSLGYQKSYLFNVMVLGFGSLAIGGILAIAFNRPVLKLLEFLTFDAYLIAKHKYAIAVFIVIMLYNNMLIMHANNYNKIAIPSAFQNLLPKLVLPLLIIGLYLDFFHVPMFARLWVLSYGIASIGLTIYVKRIGALDMKPEFTFFTRKRFRKLMRFSIYMGAGTLAGIMVGKIDVIMVGTLLGLKEVGVYSIALFIGNVLLIPATAVWQIASPVISEAFEHRDMSRVSEFYKKTSSNLLVIGIFMFFLILGTLDATLKLSPNYTDIAMATSIFAIVGFSKVIEMGASINQHILIYSPKFKVTLVFVFMMALTNVVLNYFLIRYIGILGAAISSAIASYLYLLLKCFYVEKEFGMHPFSAVTWRIGVLLLIVFAYHILLPQIAAPVVQAIIYVTGLTIVYVATLRVLKIRTDVIDTVVQQLARFPLFRSKPGQ